MNFSSSLTTLHSFWTCHDPRLSEEGKRINEITKAKKCRGGGRLSYEGVPIVSTCLEERKATLKKE